MSETPPPAVTDRRERVSAMENPLRCPVCGLIFEEPDDAGDMGDCPNEDCGAICGYP